MKSSKETIGVILLAIALILFTSGVYHLGYHNGIESMRQTESGFGGVGELISALIQIFGALIVSSIGIILKNKSA